MLGFLLLMEVGAEEINWKNKWNVTMYALSLWSSSYQLH